MIKFINNIIYCVMLDLSMAEKMSQKASSVNLNKTDKEFALKLYKDSNAIIFMT